MPPRQSNIPSAPRRGFQQCTWAVNSSFTALKIPCCPNALWLVSANFWSHFSPVPQAPDSKLQPSAKLRICLSRKCDGPAALCVFVTVHADDSASPSPSADLTTLSLAVIWEFFPGLLSRYPHPVLVRCPLFPCSHSILSTP